jgi:hypothetical protein
MISFCNALQATRRIMIRETGHQLSGICPFHYLSADLNGADFDSAIASGKHDRVAGTPSLALKQTC